MRRIEGALAVRAEQAVSKHGWIQRASFNCPGGWGWQGRPFGILIVAGNGERLRARRGEKTGKPWSVPEVAQTNI